MALDPKQYMLGFIQRSQTVEVISHSQQESTESPPRERNVKKAS